jgi:hypothetical protein
MHEAVFDEAFFPSAAEAVREALYRAGHTQLYMSTARLVEPGRVIISFDMTMANDPKRAEVTMDANGRLLVMLVY